MAAMLLVASTSCAIKRDFGYLDEKTADFDIRVYETLSETESKLVASAGGTDTESVAREQCNRHRDISRYCRAYAKGSTLNFILICRWNMKDFERAKLSLDC